MMYRNQPDKRNQLLQKINEVSFALDDILLYLDTHPCCEKGMAYYREQAEKKEKVNEGICGMLRSSDHRRCACVRRKYLEMDGTAVSMGKGRRGQIVYVEL